MIRRRERFFPLVFLFFLFSAASPAAQSPGSAEELNRKTLEGILEERGIPFQIWGNSLLIPGGTGGGGSGLILAIPLAYPGEAPLGESLSGGLEDGEGGPGSEAPLRFAVPLSLFGGKEDPPAGEALPALAFLGGADHWAELGKILAVLEAPGNPSLPGESPDEEAPDLSGEGPALSPNPAPGGRRALVFLDLPPGEGGGDLVFALAGVPPLGHLLAALRICEALELPWSFGKPFLASPSPRSGPASPLGGEPGPGVILIRPDGRPESPGSAGENLRAFLRRYAESRGPGGWNGERNYLLLRVRGKLFVIGEGPLALGFLGLGLLFCCGLLFLPPADPEDSPRRGRRIPAVAILWLCMALIAAAAFYRLSLYPLLSPALLPAFAGRSIRPALPRRICLALTLLYLGTIPLWAL